MPLCKLRSQSMPDIAQCMGTVLAFFFFLVLLSKNDILAFLSAAQGSLWVCYLFASRTFTMIELENETTDSIY